LILCDLFDPAEEVKRLPMKKPSGKYNAYDKIARSRGTITVNATRATVSHHEFVE
jgi:hypothetical protein